MLASPLSTVPSSSALSPALSTIFSPKFTSFGSFKMSLPSSKTHTFASSISLKKFEVSSAFFLPKISKNLPIKTKVMIIATESK